MGSGNGETAVAAYCEPAVVKSIRTSKNHRGKGSDHRKDPNSVFMSIELG
jgi:hypothetical protein